MAKEERALAVRVPDARSALPLAGPARHPEREPEERPGRSVVAGAFLLLEVLAREETAGLSRLAQLSGLPKASTHRLLVQLLEVDAVTRVRREYRLGPAVLRLPNAPAHDYLPQAGRRTGQALADRTGNPVGLAVLREQPTTGVDVVACFWPTGRPRDLAEAAHSAPPGAAAAQALFAERPDLPPPPPFSDLAWRRARAEIRARGVAVEQGQLIHGVACVAAPIRAADGQTVASLAVMTRSVPIPDGLAEQVRRAAVHISRNVTLLSQPRSAVPPVR
jgi:DNA-binding IclR family transcriptional regulator